MDEHQREWLDNLRALARSRGGACLSREYGSSREKLRWRCAEAHEWEARADSIRSGRWCPTCARAATSGSTMARTFARVQAIARAKGGHCLSTEYTDFTAQLRWRCAEGHEWHTTAHLIARGKWCPACGRASHSVTRMARTFAQIRAIAREKGGLCLSTEYVNYRIPLRWRCAEGHEWHTTAATIQRGSWCPSCASAARYDGEKARVFAEVQAIARERGGLCLSTEYVNSQTHLRWRCAEGHEWEAVRQSVARGSWCARCAGMVLTIDDMHEVARVRGGRCLSRSYQGEGSPLLWRCAEGHEWKAIPGNVRRGKWCPYCARNARKTIADVQGMAAEHGGVCLSTSIESSRDPLRLRCRIGHEFSSDAQRLQAGQWCPRCRGVPRGTLERLRRAVKRRGGVLLDTEYHGSQIPVRVRCREGHEWSVLPPSLTNGRWCRECWIASSEGRTNQRLSIVDMQEVAASRGGRCLSDTYVNNRTQLRWQCHDGHEWDARPASIRSGHWCPVCAYRHRGSIDGMRALAAERGGTCRSRVYQNHSDVLRFTCARGHDFTATGMAVKSGAWCPNCRECDAPAAKNPRGRGRTLPNRTAKG